MRDRDAANRVLLDRLLGQDPHNPGLDTIRDRLDHADATRAYLIRLDPSGDGKAVVAIGNPDDAANVVTHVPGTGVDLSKVGGYLNHRCHVRRRQADVPGHTGLRPG